MHPGDPQYGALRFSLRCEDAKHRCAVFCERREG